MSTMEVNQSNMSSAGICLQNPIIIQKILKHISYQGTEFNDEFMKNLNLRLLNTSFNFEILHRIRRTHRSLRMEIRKPLCLWDFMFFHEPARVNEIFVNKHCVKKDDIFDYIRFLKGVAKVKVEHLVMINIRATVSCEQWRQRLHDEIHELLDKKPLKTFVGMKDLCALFVECTKCYNCASSSSEYGPLQLSISRPLITGKKPLHFRKLIIDERRLHVTARVLFLHAPAENREKFYRYFVNPHISCDQLCFQINEVLYDSRERLHSEPLPLEVIERMCDVWEADSILIKYDYFLRSVPGIESRWSSTGTLTPFCFDELHQETDNDSDKKQRKFSSVTIDMTNTREIYGELTNGLTNENHSYSNLIANVRRVFPTDKIIIIGQRFMADTIVLPFTLDRFINILESVWKTPGHLEVTIKHRCPFVFHKHDFVIPDSIDIMGRRLNCTLLPERITSVEDFIGRTFRITDQIGEKTLNLDLFISKLCLKKLAKDREETKEVLLENGYLILF